MRGESKAHGMKDSAARRNHSKLREKFSYANRVLPSLLWQRLARRVPRGRLHLMIALADHFEPSIVPEDGLLRASHDEQQQRVEFWCREYPRLADPWRDA